MDAKLVLNTMMLAYVDANQNNNPQMRGIDWRRSTTVACSNPKTQSFTLAPGATSTLFDGTRSTSIDTDTELALTLSALSSSLYRLTWTGVGTAPVFRTDRVIAGTGVTIDVTINSNLSATAVADAGIFADVTTGDIVFIPGPSTGDAATEFSTLNEGYWVVIAVNSSTTIQLARPSDVDFSGVSESVLITDDSQLQAFSASGVQVGDKVSISAGFSASVQRIFTVTSVNSAWIEFESTATLPVDQTAVPGIDGVLFYTEAKAWFRLEITQEAVVRLNGDTSNFNRVSPWSGFDITTSGPFEKSGPTWRMDVVNLSSQPMELVLMTVE